MGDRQAFKAVQWLAYIGQKRNSVTHADNVTEVHLARVPNEKCDGYCAESNETLEYHRSFWHGCLCISNRHKPIGNTQEICRNGTRKQSEVAESRKRWL